MQGTSTLRHPDTARQRSKSPAGVNCPRKLGEHPLEHGHALLQDLPELARIRMRDLVMEIGELRVEYLAEHRGIFK